MSRDFNMSVNISAFDLDRREAIIAAANSEWRFDWSVGSPEELLGDADGSLAGGECEREFVDRLSLAIWRANGGYCEVQVDATFLECRPYETYTLDEEDYWRLLATPPDPEKGDAHAQAN